MKFDMAFVIILSHEGGYVDDLNDPGGETNMGISKRYHPDVDIKNLTIPQAKLIYRKHYWDAIKADDLDDWARLMMFDTAVNMGVKTSVRIMQKLVFAKVDGIIGPETIGCINDVMHERVERHILCDYADERLSSYIRKPNFHLYGMGWKNRTMDILKHSL